MSPAKHSYAWLPRKCDYRTDRRRTKWSLSAAMLRRRHNKNRIRIFHTWQKCTKLSQSQAGWICHQSALDHSVPGFPSVFLCPGRLSVRTLPPCHTYLLWSRSKSVVAEIFCGRFRIWAVGRLSGRQQLSGSPGWAGRRRTVKIQIDSSNALNMNYIQCICKFRCKCL